MTDIDTSKFPLYLTGREWKVVVECIHQVFKGLWGPACVEQDIVLAVELKLKEQLEKLGTNSK